MDQIKCDIMATSEWGSQRIIATLTDKGTLTAIHRPTGNLLRTSPHPESLSDAQIGVVRLRLGMIKGIGAVQTS